MNNFLHSLSVWEIITIFVQNFNTMAKIPSNPKAGTETYLFLNEYLNHTQEELCSMLSLMTYARKLHLARLGEPISPEREDPSSLLFKLRKIALDYDIIGVNDNNLFLKILESFIQVIPLKKEGYNTDKKLISLCRNYLSILQERKPKLHLSEKNISIDPEEVEFIRRNRFKKLVDHLYMSQRIASHMMEPQIFKYYSLFEWEKQPESLLVRYISENIEYDCIDPVRPIGIKEYNLSTIISIEQGPKQLQADGSTFIKLACEQLIHFGAFPSDQLNRSKELTKICCFFYYSARVLGYKLPKVRLSCKSSMKAQNQRAIRDNLKHLILCYDTKSSK